MSSVVKFWSRLVAAVTGATFALVVPVHAWAASNGVADVTIEAVKSRRRGGFGIFGLFGALCCLFVVAAIVLVIVLVRRNGRGKGDGKGQYRGQ
ncbi:hypothetical protein [Actinoplanes solisilvae]|uniref:hypothetical protein n=1 Tax=Actinoplanes solisilvae TaxID=2486853 RepID=UPI000FDAD205|nr:hypothetical protein [Actinoplanes solisilvae]